MDISDDISVTPTISKSIKTSKKTIQHKEDNPKEDIDNSSSRQKGKNKMDYQPPTASYNRQMSAPKFIAKSSHNKPISNMHNQLHQSRIDIHKSATGSNRIPLKALNTKLCKRTSTNKISAQIDISNCNPSPSDVEMAESWDINPWTSTRPPGNV